MSYAVTIRKQALKELGQLPKTDCVKVVAAIDLLADDPRPSGCKKLRGREGDMWRIRVGDYRILYTIEDRAEIVEVGKIGHRKDIYR